MGDAQRSLLKNSIVYVGANAVRPYISARHCFISLPQSRTHALFGHFIAKKLKMKTAILVDGAFYQKRANALYNGNGGGHTNEQLKTIANDVVDWFELLIEMNKALA